MTATTTVTTDGATDPDPGIGTGTGEGTEGDSEETRTAGVTAPGRATDRIATGASHATRTILAAGETPTAGMQETGAVGRLDTEMVCVAVLQGSIR